MSEYDVDDGKQLQLKPQQTVPYIKQDPTTKKISVSDCIFHVSSAPLLDYKLENLLQVHWLSNSPQSPKHITLDEKTLKLSNSYTVILGPTCIRNFQSSSGKITLYCKDVDYVYFNSSYSAKGWLCVGVYDSQKGHWEKYKQGIEFTRNNNTNNSSKTTTNTTDTAASVDLDIHHQVVVIQYRLENDPVQYNASSVFSFKNRELNTRAPVTDDDHPRKKRKVKNTIQDAQTIPAPELPLYQQPNIANANTNMSGIIFNELPDQISRITVILPFKFNSAIVNFLSANALIQEIDSITCNELEVESVQVGNRWEGNITLNTKYYTQGTYKVHVAVAGIHLFGNWTKPVNQY